MSELATSVLVGYGNVNREVARQINLNNGVLGLESSSAYVIRQAGVFAPDGQTPIGETDLSNLPTPDVAFIAVPTTADGQTEQEYLSHFHDQGTVVITAAKGASANRDPEIEHILGDQQRFGDSAVVGGGTGMRSQLKEYMGRYDVHEAHLTLNGTLAFITSTKGSLEQVAQQAADAGLAEPGSTSPYDMIRTELDDVALKTAILFNSLGLSDQEFVDWHRFQFKLSSDQIAQAMEERRRFIVSLYPKSSDLYEATRVGEESLGGFDVREGRWRVVGGFVELGRNAVRSTLESTSGADVGFAVGLGRDNADGIYSLTGPGAGPKPTASAMLGDWMRLRKSSPLKVRAGLSQEPTIARHEISATSVWLDDVKSGKVDESTLDNNEFYAVNTWRTGLRPVWGAVCNSSNEQQRKAIFAELYQRADAMEADGLHVRITPGSVTVSKEAITIRGLDDGHCAVTLWGVRDQEAYDYYYGKNMVDIKIDREKQRVVLAA